MTPEDERYLELEKRVGTLEKIVLAMEGGLISLQRIGAPIQADHVAPMPAKESEGMRWDAAVRLLHQGKKLRRPNWKDSQHIEFEEHAPHITLVDGDARMSGLVSKEDLAAKDWMVAE